MRFHVHAASCQLSSRPLFAGLLSLALLVLISHLGGSNSRRFAFNRHDHTEHTDLVTGTPGLYTSSSSSLDVEPDPQVVARLLDTLVTVPDDEVGEIAICASLRNEGRFIVEWLLYVWKRLTILSGGGGRYQYRVLGVDRFYLYDSGSDDDTLEKLQTWLRAGTVKLHRFRHDQKGHYQTTALETCSRTYGPKTEWLVEADCDEFYVVTEAMTALTRSRSGGADLTDIPQRPLAGLLAGNWLFKNSDAVVVSRLTWKNAGIDELPPDASVLASQTLREYQHSITFDKNLFTKSILHTRRKETGWVIPGAHYLRNRHVPASKAKVITANGQSVEVEPFPPNAKEIEAAGTQYSGKYPGNRVFEPIVLYHYVQRDLQDCYRKLKVAQKLRKGGWRDQAGSEGCTSYVVYEAEGSSRGIHDQNGFFGAALRDVTMAESWFGRYLPLLIVAAKEVEAAAGGGDNDQAQIEPQVVDPHPDLVAQWMAKGLHPKNGMPI